MRFYANNVVSLPHSPVSAFKGSIIQTADALPSNLLHEHRDKSLHFLFLYYNNN